MERAKAPEPSYLALHSSSERVRRTEAGLAGKGQERRITKIWFEIEDENDVLEVAEDLALLEGRELIYLSEC